MHKRRVVITGMGLVSCYGSDLNVFYNNLLTGVSGVSNITSFDCDDLPTRFGSSVKDFDPIEFLDKKQARRVDPCIAYAIAAGKRAIAHSAVDMKSLNKERAGILIGSGIGGMRVYSEGVEAIFNKNYRKVSPFFVPFILTNMPGALLAIELGFKGPNYGISTACATSNFAVVAAANHIRSGDVDLMLAGGVEASMNKMCIAGFSSSRALSRNNDDCKCASRPWDKNRDGFVIGEGCGVVVLESLEHALDRGATILAEYKDGYIACDAFHITEPTPDGSEIARCIGGALKKAQLKPEEIDYINAHATSTQSGDLCEIRALKKVFGDHIYKVKVNATKSLIGHALGASGALELITTIMSIQNNMVHPSINVTDPEDEIDGIDIVRDVKQDCNVRNAISNSFGFGGHNSVLIVSKYVE